MKLPQSISGSSWSLLLSPAYKYFLALVHIPTAAVYLKVSPPLPGGAKKKAVPLLYCHQIHVSRILHLRIDCGCDNTEFSNCQNSWEETEVCGAREATFHT